MNTQAAILVIEYEGIDGKWYSIPTDEAFSPRYVEWCGEHFNLEAETKSLYGHNARITTGFRKQAGE